MSAKPIIAGIIWLVLFLFTLLGVLGLILLSLVIPNFFSYWYILLSVIYAGIEAIVFLVLAIGLFLRKKWSFKLGIVFPIIDIVMGIILSVVLILPDILPKEIASQMGYGVAGTAVIAVIEVIAIVLVFTSKGELAK
jgi:hypothetical protein